MLFPIRLTNTRKDHPCCECEANIPKGTRAAVQSALSDHWSTFYYCHKCKPISVVEAEMKTHAEARAIWLKKLEATA